MLTPAQVDNAVALGRRRLHNNRNDESLGVLGPLPGVWTGEGRGWNMIALPAPTAPNHFRLLLNQFNEALTFDPSVLNVPNRGIPLDQHNFGVQYTQDIVQIMAVDSMGSTLSPTGPAPIHHEPGFLIHLADRVLSGPHGETLDIARMGAIPHGDTVSAMGHGRHIPPTAVMDISPAAIGDFSALPIGAGPQDPANLYLKPYFDFHAHPFKGNVAAPAFPGFDPTVPLNLLTLGGPAAPFKSVTRIIVDTKFSGGILNTPFIVKQANATQMRFVMWIQEFPDSTDAAPHFQLQYAQRVLLEFFDAKDGEGKIKWPHITINTLNFTGKAPPCAAIDAPQG